MPGFAARPVVERFLEKFEIGPPEQCWEWKANLDVKGYGQFMVYRRGRAVVKYARAHRFSYEHFVGPIPDGLQLDHLCRNPRCVNPGHLEPVTEAENRRRGKNGVLKVRRTHCKHGHALTPDNVYVKSDGFGTRQCRICTIAASRRRRLASTA